MLFGNQSPFVADDSAFTRKLLREILSRDSSIEFVGTAFNGKDAVDKTKRLQPDVITMDVEMSIMNMALKLFER